MTKIIATQPTQVFPKQQKKKKDLEECGIKKKYRFGKDWHESHQGCLTHSRLDHETQDLCSNWPYISWPSRIWSSSIFTTLAVQTSMLANWCSLHYTLQAYLNRKIFNHFVHLIWVIPVLF